jgi:alpha-glucosidase
VGAEQARVAAMLLLTLRGTPTIYYGDEIGLPNADIPADLVCDPLGKSVPFLGRDGARGPMRWDATSFGGFSDAAPWCVGVKQDGLPNVAEQQESATSMLTLYKRLIEARRCYPALAIGTYHPLVATGNVLLFRRSHAGAASVIVALNLGDQPAAVLHGALGTGKVIVSAFGDRNGEIVKEEVDLRPNEGLVVEIADSS